MARRLLLCGTSLAVGSVSAPGSAANNFENFELAMGFFIALCLFLCGLFYIIPGVIAAHRGHQNQRAIWLLTIFLGWTGIAWIVALVWALNPPGKVSP